MAADIAVIFVAIQHVAFFVLESILWGRPAANRIFRVDADTAAKAAVFARNQGVYNLFLVAGLAWALLHPDANASRQMGLFFTGCVVVAGVAGGLTANIRILFVQAVPGAVALALVWAREVPLR